MPLWHGFVSNEVQKMSVSIHIDHVTKKFGDNVIIPDLSANIKNSEFFTLLGPSGCGKTTLLRMIAGFNSIEAGEIRFGDQRINEVPTYERNIGMVFQSYAIFPHLTVRRNVEYGLRIRKTPHAEMKQRVDEMLKLVRIDEYQDRLPERLSGGQQQRVALARAIVIHPQVLLMDEPLSNLDAKLRIEMREVIKEIQNDLGITTVYVTHDQEEAMAVSDRIAVMNAGVIQQIGKPKELYQRPSNLFVATFIGRTNVLQKKLTASGGALCVDFDGYLVPMGNLTADAHDGQAIQASVRPEEFVITDGDADGIEGTVEFSTFLGLNTHYLVRLKSGERVEIIQESKIEDILEKGSTVRLSVKGEKINIFTEDGETSLIRTNRRD